MYPDLELHLTILNGYPRKSRENFDKQNVGHPHDFFMAAIRRYVPKATFDVLFIADMDDALPIWVNVGSYNGVIWTGSDLTIYHHDDERVTRQIELARLIYAAGVPSIGSCWGLQMAIAAAGGEVKKNPKGREWGIARDIQLTDAGRESPLLRGKPDVFDGFIMHLDDVTTLTDGTTLLATNQHTQVQAAEVVHENGTFWATQYHPEYNLYEMARLIQARAAPLVREGFFETTDAVQHYADQMFALSDNPDSEDLRETFDVDADILDDDLRQVELRNWLEYLVVPTLPR